MIKPIFTVKCAEPEGDIERSVFPLFITPRNLQKFWDAAKQFPTIYGREIKSIEDFMNLFLSIDENGKYTLDGLFFVVPDESGDNFIGVFYLTDITATEANVHYSFFDKRHRGRVPLVKEMIRYVFEKYGFRRLNAVIPCYTSKFVRHFVSNVGFKLEGRKRSAAKYKDDWYDVMMYGMLYSEISASLVDAGPIDVPPTNPIDEVSSNGDAE